MTVYGGLQLALFLGCLFLLTKPVGLCLVRVLDPGGRTWLDRPLKPVERLLYRFLGVDPAKEQDWRSYTRSLLLFSLAGLLFTYAVLRLQHLLPLNPQRFGPLAPDLAFNTAASFTTNTNWQNYAGETTLSYFSQMVGLVFHNFVSAAAGIAVAAALVRGLARHASRTVGNFWVDLVRVNLYLLLPMSLVLSLFLASQGVVQNFRPYVKTAAGAGATGAGAGNAIAAQVLPQGPAASQVAIKMLGTNGGGFFNANAAHPYENPTPLSNFVQMLAIFLIPAGLTYYLGRKVKDRKHGWAVWTSMALLFLVAALVCWKAESAGNPRLRTLGLDPRGGSMEGKEVRFGVPASALFATVTTDASCGAVNAMHDSFTPLGGLVPLVNIELGEVVFGGVGSGLYGMIVFIVLAVFLTGLMVGRTPEYLGKKIEAYDVKVSVLTILVPIFAILGFSAAASVGRWGLAGLGNAGPHGLSEIIYAFSSAAGNNGSAFAGLDGNTPAYNVALALAMLCGRFVMIVPVMALAGSLARKKLVPADEASFPVSGAMFIGILVGTVVIVGALTFLPALALGPIVEHFLMTGSGVLF
ncbi:MAG TPA: potassium-transporting ATPase subunit KdpA [Candidatus Aminicenantes bacterium]|nr:potassium-transporting ATPase subunit KdpA [Candidatus Aminicenantes bacterium]HRY64939.1 potassium-transporting ATPase subunit KdpA [Candidatus Aminicenantes bacterium]HRZ71852.1 potassium-transporting ATPase subunit KdpA [Candidatus Aminicenantes bacterium]